MEEKDAKFKVREKLKGLQIRSGFRLFMIYFTDIKMYLIETDHTSHHSSIGWGFLQNMIRTKISSHEKQYEKFEKMDDTRDIMTSCCWYRIYPYENIVSMWIEEVDDLNKLWFDLIATEKRKKYYGDEDGADFLWFKKEFTEEYVRVLKKILGYKFHGIKTPDQ